MTNLTAADVAIYILEKKGGMSAIKLPKLVYYSQVCLVWNDEPLFDDPIEAWTNGPIIPSLYHAHKGHYQVSIDLFDGIIKKKLSDKQKETINTVLEAYSDKSAQWLSDQTYLEKPWMIARNGLADNKRGSQAITLESMAEYYSSI